MTPLAITVAGMIGFGVVCALGLYQDRPWARTLISAALAALAYGLVGHWWMQLWYASLANAQQEQAQAELERQQQAQAEAQAATAEGQQEAPTA